jgi:Domain of unknown function (DUF1707)
MLAVDRARAEVPVMASPGGETAAGAQRHARLRASAADREQAIEVLKAAFVQDRITKDELDQRIGKVLASRTYDDLDVLTADIPAGLIRARPAQPARRPDEGKMPIRRASTVVAGTGFVLTETALAALPHYPVSALGALVAGSVIGAFAAGLLAMLLTLIKWVLDRSSGRQPAQGPPPGARDSAARHPSPASPDAQPRQIGHRPWPGAEAARSRLPRSPSASLRSLATLALSAARTPARARVP